MPHILDSLAEFRIAQQAAEVRNHLRDRTHERAMNAQKAATPPKARPVHSLRLPIPLGTTSAASRTAPADPDRHGTDGPCPPRVDCGSAALSRPA